MCWSTYFIVFCEHQPKFTPPPQKKVHVLQSTGSYKKTVLLQPPSWPKIGVFQLVFSGTNNIDAEQKHNLKSGKNKDKKKGISKRKQDRRIDEKSFAIESFDVVPFVKQKQRTQKNKERDKTFGPPHLTLKPHNKKWK